MGVVENWPEGVRMLNNRNESTIVDAEREAIIFIFRSVAWQDFACCITYAEIGIPNRNACAKGG